MTDLDRDAVLARRRLLISTAIAGLACTAEPSRRPPEQPEPNTAALEPEPPPRPQPEPPPALLCGDEQPWADVLVDAPPIEVPEGLTHYESNLLFYECKSWGSNYAWLAEVWRALPSCDPSADDCEGWQQVSDTLADIEKEPRKACGWGDRATHTAIERDVLHRQYWVDKCDEFRAEAEAQLERFTSPEAKAAWQAKLDATARRAMARSCLSCVDGYEKPVHLAFEFGFGQAELDDQALAQIEAELMEVIATHSHNLAWSARLFVRGHASIDEDDPMRLSRARAEFIAELLIERGNFAADQFEVVGHGTHLAITNDPQQLERNRRVDFQVQTRFDRERDHE